MKKYLMSYATRKFKESQELLEESALLYGIDHVFSLNQDAIRGTEFYRTNKKILRQEKGAGFWLWKPHLLLETMEKIAPGDILVYADAGMEVVAPLDPLFEIMLHTSLEVLTFGIIWRNRQYTKRDCFVLMGCDTERYWNAEMRDGGFSVYKKTGAAIRFLEQWLAYCQDERILTDVPNTQGYPNLDGFIAHRHDQSVFSLLAERAGFEIFRDPSQFGNHQKLPAYRQPGEYLIEAYSDSPRTNSPYGTLSNRHRRKTYTLLQKGKRRASFLLKRAIREARNLLP